MISLRDRVEYLGYRILGILIRRFPRAPMHALGSFCGRLVYRVGGKHVRWGLANVGIAFPELDDAGRRKILADSYAAFGRNAIDFVRAERWSDEVLREHISIEGMELVNEAFARGKGVFFVSAHTGNFELGVRAFATLGMPFLVIGRPMRNKLLYARLERSRTRNGQVRLVDRDQAAMPMVRAIKSNHGIGVLIDQYVRKRHGVFVPLFGVRCSTTPTVAAIALRTGASLVCATAHRDGPDHHVVRFSPIEAPTSEGAEGTPEPQAEDRITVLTAACNRAIEKQIRAYPDQWLWSHRRFRHSPDLDHDPYT